MSSALSASTALNEADTDRFAMLFSPATPPTTPTLVAPDHPSRSATARPRRPTQGSSDSEFGAFVSVPSSQDPLSHDADLIAFTDPVSPGNHSLVYFDQFTAGAKTAVERNKRVVLDELLQHQDDPMYFLDTQPITTTTASPVPPLTTCPDPNSSCSAAPIPIPIPMSTDDALAEALASDMPSPKLIRVEHGGSIKVAPSPSLARHPLPPFLSGGTASPPSTSSPSASTTSLSSTLLTASSVSSTSASASTLASGSSSYPAHATLSRISSSLVSLLPSNRPHSRAQTHPTTTTPSSSVPSTTTARSQSATSHTLTHGSPFSSTPYIPPSGAPGFAGDRTWDRGFSDALAQEENCSMVDPTRPGPSYARHSKGKGVTLAGRRESTTRVLTEDMADLIRPYLPALIKLPPCWTLLYSLDQHGISANTLYARSAPRVPSRAHPNPPKGGLLVIQDGHDAVFGAWMNDGIRLGKGGYYGSGESFLWRYHPPLNGERGEGRLDVYKWTGANDYVALCEPGFISFGGGDGHYGLYLDASLLDGSSAPCPTFGNPPLCASAQGHGVARTKGEVTFECVGLEVWGIGEDREKKLTGGMGI